MKKYNRIFVIVLDSLGIGAMPDSEKFGDVGVDTFGHILDQMGTLEIPNLKKLGMLNLHCGGNMEKAAEPMGRYARLGEASNGKDTMTRRKNHLSPLRNMVFRRNSSQNWKSAAVRELSAIRAPAEQRSSKSWARKKSIPVQ